MKIIKQIVSLGLVLLASTFLPLGYASANPYGTSNVVLDGGFGHQCAFVKSQGTVNCWGTPNPYGIPQNRYGEAEDYLVGDALNFASGDYDNCILREDGNTHCWGESAQSLSYNHDGNPENLAIDLSVGYSQACVLTAAKNVMCTGNYLKDVNGQSLNGRWGTFYDGGDANWVIASSYAMCVSALSISHLQCGGWNVTEPTWLTEGTPIAAAGGHYAMCVLLENGNVDCMNNTYNEFGQTAGYRGGDAVDTDAQFDKSCAVTSAGDVKCWGRNTADILNVGAVSVSVAGWGDICYANSSGLVNCTVSTPDELAIGPVDSDGDGVTDDIDAFPNDATETTDSDGDGVGDNGDVFPNDATESADSDGDGVGDNADENDNSDMSDTVSIGGINSGVTNAMGDNGVTLADLVNDIVATCAANANNHGRFVSCFGKQLNELKKAGVISGSEKGALQSAAASSSIGK